MVHLKVDGDIGGELEREAVMKQLNRVVIDAYETSYRAETAKSSRDVA